jgi:hypothetical protein
VSGIDTSPLQAIAQHVGEDEVPWVENPSHPGAFFRLLQADVARGLYVMAGRLRGELEVGTHRHTGAVHMFTLSGAWKYHEHAFVNRAGSYLYEPAGSVHTFYVPPGDTVTETLTIVHGTTEYLGPDGELLHTSDAASSLRTYYEGCERAGVPRPSGILR